MAKHIGSLSYTQDHKLIYSIYVYPPLKQSYKNKLVEYFSKFGDVENINMITEKRYNRNLNSAVVRFKNPESASKALRLKTHRFLDRKIYIKSYCKQPYGTKLISGDIDNPSTQYTILKLNDDCLFSIFQYLSLQDQYNLSTLCGRLENIYESSIKMKKSIRITERDISNINCLRIALEKCGPNIQCITFSSSFDDSMENLNFSLDHLSKLCPNLYKLNFFGVSFNNDIFQKIYTNFDTLRHIELKIGGLDDDMIEKLTNLSNIKYLDLTYNPDITGLYLHKFYNLETLILNCCYDIESTNFIRICSTINNLKELNINRCDKLETHDMDALVNNLNHLEILTISMTKRVNYDKIAKLKSLKHLTINEEREDRSTSLLKKLAKEKSNQLETLKLGNFTYNNINGDAIKKLNKLKQLDIPDEYITNEFFNGLSRLRHLKILNVPSSVNVKKEIVLEYLHKIPATLEEIDMYHLDCDEEFVIRASEILKFQHRIKPLILTLKATSIKKKLFVEDDVEILKIKTTEIDYDFSVSYSDGFDSYSNSSYDSDNYYYNNYYDDSDYYYDNYGSD